jgi:hypothetical protein
VWPKLAAALFGVAVFVALGGAPILDPGHTSWILKSDWGYHFIAWLFYRQSPWQLPVGAIPNLFHPIGTTIGFNDGIPWLALLAKLASPILPDPAQYAGPWLGLCYALQGWFGARLARTVGARPVAAALAGALLTLAPFLTHRLNHEALCAHWLILWGLALALEPAPRVWEILALPALAMGIHPYLCLMIAGLVAVAAARRGARTGIAAGAGAAAIMAGLALLFGYVGPRLDDIEGTGFGHYASDVLSLLSPMGLSRLWPELPMHAGEQEGYAWLGLGVLALGVSALPLLSRRLPWRRAAPVVAVAIVCAIFAWSSEIAVAGKVVVNLSRLYAPFRAVTGAFRSSGRFIWPLAYLLAAGAIAVWCARRPRWAPVALAAALVLQAADLKGLGTNHFAPVAPIPPLPAALAGARVAHVALYPPRCGDGSYVCCQGFTPPPKKSDFALAFHVTRLGATFNSGGASRVFRSRFADYCRDLQRDVRAGALDPETLYLVAKEQQAAFTGALCRPLEGELGCVAWDAVPALRAIMNGPTSR